MDSTPRLGCCRSLRNGTVIQHLSGNETDSVNVFNEADIAKQVINNTAVTIRQFSPWFDSGLPDSTITVVFGGCTNIETAIDNGGVTDTVMDPDGNDAATYPFVYLSDYKNTSRSCNKSYLLTPRRFW